MAWNLSAPKAEYFTLGTPGLESLIAALKHTRRIAIDTETTGLNTWKDIPLYWSLAFGNRRITLHASTLSLFKKDVFDDPTKEWLLSNAKFDQHMLSNVGCHLAGNLNDINVKHALLYEDRPHGLKQVNQHLFGTSWVDFQDTFGKIGKLQTAEQLIRKAEATNMPLLIEYAANDSWGTLQADIELEKQLQNAVTFSLFREIHPYIETLHDYYHKLEKPYTRVLWQNERHGIKIDRAEIERIRPLAEQEIEETARDINRLAGRMLNPNSGPQLRDYFINKVGLKALKKTNGGKSGVRNASIDGDFLEFYAETDPVAKSVLRHRELSKLYGTYIVGIGELLDPNDRVHTRFNQDVARCMPAGELVLTCRGYLPVQHVKTGDMVIGHSGQPRKVIETSTHEPQPIYRVTLSNGLVLRTTGNHMYHLQDLWMRADDLSPGDIVTVHSDKEEWRDIPRWEGFQISSWGRVKSRLGKILKLNKKGKRKSLFVTLIRNGAQRRSEDRKDLRINRLVAEAFGLGFDDIQHANNIEWDNTLGNLRAGYPEKHNRPSVAKFHTATVVEVIELPPAYTFGLTVEIDHSHVTGGIVTHNTGRLSSASPNLQNTPRAENDKWKLRKLFIAEEGYDLLVADGSQLEMRVLAIAAQDENMCGVIRAGKDIHMGNAELIYGIPYDDFKKAKKTEERVKKGELPESDITPYIADCLFKRTTIKTIGFGLVYGMGVGKLAATLGVSKDQAQQMIEDFNEALPAVARFAEEAVAETMDTGYAFSIMGRRRAVPEIMSSNNGEHEKGKRIARNTPIQSSASDVIRMVQLLLHASGIESRLGCRPVLQVHDEIVQECPKENSEEAMAETVDWMRHPFVVDLMAPFDASIGKGQNWLEAK